MYIAAYWHIFYTLITGNVDLSFKKFSGCMHEVFGLPCLDSQIPGAFIVSRAAFLVTCDQALLSFCLVNMKAAQIGPDLKYHLGFIYTECNLRRGIKSTGIGPNVLARYI